MILPYVLKLLNDEAESVLVHCEMDFPSYYPRRVVINPPRARANFIVYWPANIINRRLPSVKQSTQEQFRYFAELYDKQYAD